MIMAFPYLSGIFFYFYSRLFTALKNEFLKSQTHQYQMDI